ALTSRTDTANARPRKVLSETFVIAQVTLAVVLLTTAGVLTRSYHTLATVNVGADTSEIVTMSLYTPPERYVSADSRQRFYADVSDRLRALRDVTSVGLGTAAPAEFAPQVDYAIQGDAARESADRRWSVIEFVVSPGYFRTLRVPVIAGREFGDREQTAAEPVAIVNQRFASRDWPGATAIGKRIRLTVPGND